MGEWEEAPPKRSRSGGRRNRVAIARHAEKVIGMLNGWDRIRLRGTLRWLANLGGMNSYLCAANVLLKDFKAYVQQATELRQATVRTAEEAGRPVICLASSAIRKEDMAEIAQRDGVQEGLICVLTWRRANGPAIDDAFCISLLGGTNR